MKSDDTISRQAALDLCERFDGSVPYSVLSSHDMLPSVSTEKTGRWITKIKSDLMGDMWPTNPKCSECGGEPYYSNTIYNYNFCPYCGAKMGAEE